MTSITMKELLEAGVHFGHQTKQWNPKMKPYIFGARSGVYIVDLQKTAKLFKNACKFLTETVGNGGNVLFVGTKRQAQDPIREEAQKCGMFYVTNRWMGGMLTNFQTIKKNLDRLKEIEKMETDGTLQALTKKEAISLKREERKLERSLGGVKEMKKLPSAVFIVDTKKERIAVKEAQKLAIPIVGVVDTNSDPEGIDYIIPGNDDAIRSIRLFATRVSDACQEGTKLREEALRTDTDEKTEKKKAKSIIKEKAPEVKETVKIRRK